jgi:single-stranded DNA-binding protein
VAVTTGWGDRKVTTWWHVEQWGKPSEWIGELRKGAAVTVIGEAYMREWTSKDGKAGTTPTIKAVEVVAHERAPASSGGKPQQRKPQGNGGGWGGGRDDDGF